MSTYYSIILQKILQFVFQKGTEKTLRAVPDIRTKCSEV